MANQRSRLPWDGKSRAYVKKVLDQIGDVSGVPLQARHLPTGTLVTNPLADTRDPDQPFAVREQIRIGSRPLMEIGGIARDNCDLSTLQTAVRLAQGVLTEYLRHRAEIESFSREVIANYEVINMLYRVADALGSIQDVQRVATIILRQAALVTRAERGSVLLLDRNQKRLRMAAAYGFSQDRFPSISVALSDTLCSEVVRTGEPLLVDDIRTRPDLAAFSKGEYRTRSFIAFPLQTVSDHGERQLLGVLNLSEKVSEAPFKSNDLKLLTALTSQAAVAISNARMLEELKESKQELNQTLSELVSTYADLDKRSVFIEQVNKIALSINATLDLNKLVAKICLYAKSLTGAEEALVYLKKEGPSEEPMVHSSSEGACCKQPYELPFLTGLFAGTEQARFLSGCETDGLGGGRTDGQQAGVWRNLLAVPFASKKNGIGGIAVMNKTTAEGFVEEDADLLKALGHQAANAVENAKLVTEQKAMLMDTITALAAAVDAKDAYTHNHSRKVSLYARAIAEVLGLQEDEMEILQRAALLHDIGKIAIPEAILNKPDRLTRDEFETMKTHPMCGVRILENIKEMESIIEGIRYHHERHDGNGYPEGLRGEGIPRMARILAVADTYDAITSDRPYRKGPGHEFACEEIQRGSGTQFAPEVVEAFLNSTICRGRPSASAVGERTDAQINV